ncbi:MAG: GspH/FimT family pseudopilin [Pseudomonadota bacterium]
MTSRRGFSIVELMVVMTIASVLLLYAMPAFNDFTTQRRMAANANAMVAAINLTRSEASLLGGTVSLQANAANAANDEWGDGFCVTQGSPGNCNNPLRVFPLEGQNFTFNALGGLNEEYALSYNSRGMILNNLAGVVLLCGQDADDDPGRTIDISAIGRASVRETNCF